MGQPDLAVGIGGAAGDGVASAGNTLALSVARQGLGVYAYNSYQSVIRGGHSWLRLRISARKPLNHGDQAHFASLTRQLQSTDQRWALVTGNELLAMGAALAGCKFYCAYPMSPATHILEWFAAHAKELGICVRQVEDEISVINMTIGASHMGVRGMCATSGGGFALMTEAVGMAGIIETPVVVVNVQRAGPSTGVPTKTEQGDLNQALGASQGDFPRIVIAPLSIHDCFETPALAFNFADRYQCPVIILSDLLLGEGNETVDPALLEVHFDTDRGELTTTAVAPPAGEPYLRYKDTPSGISPRTVPGVPHHLYVAATDEHDEDGVLLSDVYTDPGRRTKMVRKRARKMVHVLENLPAPTLQGPADAEVTLIGWGSTWGALTEAVEQLNREGLSANHLQIKFLVPFHAEEVGAMLHSSRRIIIVENNQSGQFARHLRAETGIAAHGHIRKFDGEPFEPKHIVGAVREIAEMGTDIVEVVSTEAGWRTEHPTGASGDWAGRHIAPTSIA